VPGAHADLLDVGSLGHRGDRFEGGPRRTAGHAVPALLEGDRDAHGRFGVSHARQ
jgi:hypothetical protein